MKAKGISRSGLVERNQRIVALRDQGWTFNDISREVKISVGHVNMLYYKHCARPGDEEVPDGMSLLTAREVKAVLEVWPSRATAEIIAMRMMELLRNSRKQKSISEVTLWLEGLGFGWGTPSGWKP